MPRPNTPEQAADKVLATFEAKDTAALAALATDKRLDPWLVADELCGRGENDAAAAFATAAPGKHVEGLSKYVAGRLKKPVDRNVRADGDKARVAFNARRPAEALALTESVRLGDDVPSIRAVCIRAQSLWRLNRLEEAEGDYVAAAKAAEEIGWLYRTGLALHRAAVVASQRAEYGRALTHGQRALDLYRICGIRPDVAAALINLGTFHDALGDYDHAKRCFQEGLSEAKAAGHRHWAANALGSIGKIEIRRGDYTSATKHMEEARALLLELGDEKGVAITSNSLGIIRYKLADYPAAIDHYTEALAYFRKLEHRRGEAWVLSNLANIHKLQGDLERSLQTAEAARRLQEDIGDRAGLAASLHNLGTSHEKLGNLALALHHYELALARYEEIDLRASVDRVLSDLGDLHKRLGDYAKAKELMSRALEGLRARKMPREVAVTLNNLGHVHEALGNDDEARRCYREQLDISREIGDRAGTAGATMDLGVLAWRRGKLKEAQDQLEEALALSGELGEPVRVASCLLNLGLVSADRGDPRGSLDLYGRALAEAEKAESRVVIMRSHGNIAGALLALGELPEAVAAARRAVAATSGLVRGLADEQGARARGEYAFAYGTGTEAAVQLGDLDAAFFFVESGRAGALLEALRLRDTLRESAIPAELREEENRARATAAVAAWEHQRALASGKRKEIRTRRKELEEARGAVTAVVERIQRSEKARLLYPRAATLDAIQATLRTEEAMVLYALHDEAVALVVTAKGARVVRLGDPQAIERACAGLDLGNPAKLRQDIIAPLRLDASVRRLLVSPDGSLTNVPFVLLAEGREVAYVPSGSTYEHHVRARDERGEGVLALGAPAYGTRRDVGQMTVMRGARLPSLPGSGAEATAIGDDVLLGKEASETRFRQAVTGGRRWRAVHLACHGLIRTDLPLLSSLALTPANGDDGFLTVLDVFRLKIPADLVVLSACETARGKVYKAEGMIGFTRAFMVAGVPRVIVSLWKVDDEATRALMVRFYELWNPKDGSKGLPTATALKKAQEFVRDHPKWKHPSHWAAWQLWGLPD